jgi:hypothetical protein
MTDEPDYNALLARVAHKVRPTEVVRKIVGVLLVMALLAVSAYFGLAPPRAARFSSSPRARAARPAPSPTTNPAMSRSTRGSTCPAIPSRSTPASTGHAAP